MKTITLVIALVIASQSIAAAADKAPSQSELKLRGCLSLVYSNAAASKLSAKEVTKAVSTGVKECRIAVRETQKNERLEKKRAKLKEQIAKLQSKLSAN